MNKLYRNLLVVCSLLLTVMSVKAEGWPANYQGVMLQGFYWDSYTDTKWTNLEAQADEYSKYFSLIWVPNSGKCASNPGMGYDPVYWFSNHNSAFGTQAQLTSMIEAYKEKGVGIIADVVINHRSGVSNWTNFPAETWNGKTYKIGPEGICCTDEVKDAAGQAKPTGAPDTGEDFNGSRDLDHTNANVQDNCKNYCKFLLDELGYAGFRLDMVKGYGGQYTKIYNQYAKPRFCVGEYWDGSYDAVKGWIDATGKESAAFDFPFKYAVNKAFSSGDMTQLVWKANGTTDQPAGMIHFGYAQYAVTFIDNHDTYRDGNKFTGNVVAANAFMLCSPGTPCVFLPHYKAYKAAIQALVNIRNSVGVHNMSAVKVLKSTSNCYMAEVTGTKGKLVVKIGSDMSSPSGYSDSDIKASGNDYCVWTKVGVSPTPTPTPGDDYPEALYMVGNLSVGNWDTTAAGTVKATGNKGVYTFKDVKFADSGLADAKNPVANNKSYFSFLTTTGADWDVVNGADRYGASAKDAPLTSSATITKFAVGVDASAANSWQIATGTYTIVADLTKMTVRISDGGDDPTPGPTPTPGDVTIYYDNSESGWSAVNIYYWTATPQPAWPGVAMTKVEGNIYKYTFTEDPSSLKGIIFCNAEGSDQTADYLHAPVNNHLYKGKGGKGSVTDMGEYQGGDDPQPGNYPATVYLIGDVNGESWNIADPLLMTKNGGIYTASDVKFENENTGVCTFSFITAKGTDWDSEVNQSDRYGAASDMTSYTVGDNAAVTLFKAGVNASAAGSWAVAPGKYNVTLDLTTMKMKLANATSSVDDIEAVDEVPALYYNLQGVRVAQPAAGLYIKVSGSKVEKVYVK